MKPTTAIKTERGDKLVQKIRGQPKRLQNAARRCIRQNSDRYECNLNWGIRGRSLRLLKQRARQLRADCESIAFGTLHIVMVLEPCSSNFRPLMVPCWFNVESHFDFIFGSILNPKWHHLSNHAKRNPTWPFWISALWKG